MNTSTSPTTSALRCTEVISRWRGHLRFCHKPAGTIWVNPAHNVVSEDANGPKRTVCIDHQKEGSK